MLALRLHPQLGQVALAKRNDGEYRAWVTLRARDAAGCSHIPLRDARQWLREALGLSARQVRRILNDGAGHWWSSDGRTLHLRSLASVCHSLGLERKPGAPILLDVEQVRQLKAFRGFCLSAQFANGKMIDKPVSVSTLAKRAGRSRRTAHAYLRLAGVRVVPNLLLSTRKPDTLDAEEARQGWRVMRIGGRVVLARHLPNSYFLDARVGPVGRARKVTTGSVGTRGCGRGKTRSRLRWVAAHGEPQRARRAVSRLGEGDVAYVTEKPIPAPRGASARQWDGYAKANDTVYRL